MDPREMLFKHRYTEAAKSYRKLLKKESDEYEYGDNLVEYSTALLCLGQLNEALQGFFHANEIAKKRLRGESQPYLEKIGVIHWLLGNRAEAIKIFRSGIQGVLKGIIKFTDNAGGVSHGLLLWYAGVTERDIIAKEESVNYLGKLAKKSRIQYWPGPLGLYVLGKSSFDEVLISATDTNNLTEAFALAKTDLLKRRYLCQLLFYAAVNQRNIGDENGCLERMKNCIQLENPILEVEWYLARNETEKAGE